MLVRQAVTQAFWAEARNEYTMAISRVVLEEINRNPTDALRQKMLELVDGLDVLEMTLPADRLARALLDQGVVPPKKRDDALHLALAVERGFDYMVNVRVQRKLPVVCAQHSFFRQVSIVSPQAFIGSNEL